MPSRMNLGFLLFRFLPVSCFHGSGSGSSSFPFSLLFGVMRPRRCITHEFKVVDSWELIIFALAPPPLSPWLLPPGPVLIGWITDLESMQMLGQSRRIRRSAKRWRWDLVLFQFDGRKTEGVGFHPAFPDASKKSFDSFLVLFLELETD